MCFSFGKPLFDMCWFYIAQIALAPPPLSSRQTWKKSAPNHPGKLIHPPPFPGNAHMETTHFKKGFP